MPSPTPTARPATDLSVADSVASTQPLKPGKRIRLVKVVAKNEEPQAASAVRGPGNQSWIKGVHTQCYLNNQRLTGEDKDLNCTFRTRTTEKKAVVKVTPHCSRGLKVRAKIVARAPGSRRTSWKRTWRVESKPPITCALHANG